MPNWLTIVVLDMAKVLVPVALAALLTLYVHETMQKKQRQIDAARLAGALRAELSSLEQRYKESVGIALEEAQEWSHFLVTWPIASDYFTVFTQNAGRLGLLEPQDAEAVVRTYVMAKGHIDGMRQWGRYCEEFDQIVTKSILELDPTVRNVYLAHADKSLEELPKDKPKIPKLPAQQLDSGLGSVPQYGIIKLKLKGSFGPLKKSHKELLAEFSKVKTNLRKYQTKPKRWWVVFR